MKKLRSLKNKVNNTACLIKLIFYTQSDLHDIQLINFIFTKYNKHMLKYQADRLQEDETKIAVKFIVKPQNVIVQ